MTTGPQTARWAFPVDIHGTNADMSAYPTHAQSVIFCQGGRRGLDRIAGRRDAVAHIKHNVTYEFPEMNPDERLRELILYISAKCTGDIFFGATKLNKILWHSDAASYAYYGTPVTGANYFKLEHGPAPKRLLPIKRQMVDRDEITEKNSFLGQRAQHRIIPLREPDLTKFTARDIAVVDQIIEALWNKEATEVSRESHIRAWEQVGYKQSIAYESIFLSSEGITDRDIEKTKALASKYGWR